MFLFYPGIANWAEEYKINNMDPNQPTQEQTQPVQPTEPMQAAQPVQVTEPVQSAAPIQDDEKHIVIVEDDTSLADIYKTRLELLGYKCQVASDGIAALYFIQTQHPDLVLLDLMVPDIAGDEILRRMRASKWGKDIPVYVISNLNEADAPAGLRELGIAGYSVKVGMTNDMLDKLVNQILKPAGQTEDVLLEKTDSHENISGV